MTTKRTYQCDICKQSGSAMELHGLHWERGGWKKQSSTECEHHICQTCLDSVTAIGNEYMAVRPISIESLEAYDELKAAFDSLAPPAQGEVK